MRGFAKVTRDMTTHKRAQEQLLAAKEEAERSNRFKDQFLPIPGSDSLLELKASAHPWAFPARIVRTAANDCMGFQIENAGAEENKNSRNSCCRKFCRSAINLNLPLWLVEIISNRSSKIVRQEPGIQSEPGR